MTWKEISGESRSAFATILISVSARLRVRSMDRETVEEIKRHFDVVAEGLRSDIRLVAEGIAGVDEKFTLEFKSVREEIGEVKSLLRASYADLDRRVQALERKPS